MNKLLTVIIVVLVLYVAFSKNGCSPRHQKSDTVTVHDTTWSVHDTTIYKTLIGKGKILHDTIQTPPEYIADTNYPRLLAQYKDLLSKYMALVEFKDTIRIDTLGYVSIIDTVNQNNIKGRSVRSNYKIPTITITNTITNYAPPKAMLFFGGGVQGNQTLGVTGANIGILYKSKKDKIVGFNVGSTIGSQLNYGISSYWKIK
jgi:hypothetical protein